MGEVNQGRVRGQVEELLSLAPNDPDMAYGLGCLGSIALAFTGCQFLPDETGTWTKVFSFLGFLMVTGLISLGLAEFWMSTKRRIIMAKFKRFFPFEGGLRQEALDEFAVLLKVSGREISQQQFIETIFQRLGGVLAANTNVHNALEDWDPPEKSPVEPEKEKSSKKTKNKTREGTRKFEYIPLDLIAAKPGPLPGTLVCVCGSVLAKTEGSTTPIKCMECGKTNRVPE